MRPESHPYLGDLLGQTQQFVRSFVVVDEHQLTATALWNAHTYVYDCARATPYLHPHSPEPGSGKTTLLDVLEVTARNAIQADNLTEAVLFRLIDKSSRRCCSTRSTPSSARRTAIPPRASGRCSTAATGAQEGLTGACGPRRR